MENALKIEQLTKQYKDFKLDELSLEVPKGSIMGFVGQNGAGKTTTIKLILNMVKKDSGTITVLGMDPIKQERKIKEQIGVVLSEGFFYEKISPKEINLIMKNTYQNWDQRLFYDFLNRFSLPEKKVLKEFSTGMKMKLNLAAALSHHPKLLLLDEPTSGLDPVVRNEILDLFLDFIQDEEHAIFLSSHITSDLEKICDYITFINDGKMIFSKTKDEVLYDYCILKCGKDEFPIIDKEDIIRCKKGRYGYELLMENRKALEKKYAGMVLDEANIEEIMMLYAQEDN